MRRFVRRHALALAAALAVGILGAWQLFHPPCIGIADNHDFMRVYWQVGVDYESGLGYPFFFFWRIKWRYIGNPEIHYLTSEVWLARLSVPLSKLFFGPDLYDLRVLGAIELTLYVVGIYFFVAAQEQRRRWVQVLLAALVVLIFCDVRLVAYFNTFYSEGASLLFGMLTIGLALLACRRRGGLAGWLTYLAFATAATLLCLAKSQDMVFAPPLALLLVLLFPPLPGPRVLRVVGVVPALALLGLMIWALNSHAYDKTRPINVQVHLDEELFPHSPTPNRDRWELGILDRGDDYSTVTLGKIAMLYAHHPRRWWQLAGRALEKHAFSQVLNGSYDDKSGMGALIQSHDFDVWGDFKEKHMPRSLPLLLLLAAAMVAGWLVRIMRGPTPADRYRAVTALMVLAGCVGQFVVCVTFEANGTPKHLFMFNVLTDVLLLLALGDLGDSFSRVVDRRRARQ